MCNKRYCDTIAIIVSVLIGITFMLLALFNILTAVIFTPLLAVGLGVLAIFVVTISAASLLRQNEPVNQCLCRRGNRLLIAAIWLIIVASFTVIFALTNIVIGLILAFLLYSLIAFTFISLYCFLHCMSTAGCSCNED